MNNNNCMDCGVALLTICDSPRRCSYCHCQHINKPIHSPSPAPAGGDIDTGRSAGGAEGVNTSHPWFMPCGDHEINIEPEIPKLRYDLIPPLALQECAKGWTAGGNKYDDDSWRSVSETKRIAKIMRHLQQYRLGEKYDKETIVHHLACVANNALMLCELSIEEGDRKVRREMTEIFGEPIDDQN